MIFLRSESKTYLSLCFHVNLTFEIQILYTQLNFIKVVEAFVGHIFFFNSFIKTYLKYFLKND